MEYKHCIKFDSLHVSFSNVLHKQWQYIVVPVKIDPLEYETIFYGHHPSHIHL